jgi:small glutamine-rich tetratricopeptide repeat-containing protein alpha
MISMSSVDTLSIDRPLWPAREHLSPCLHGQNAPGHWASRVDVGGKREGGVGCVFDPCDRLDAQHRGGNLPSSISMMEDRSDFLANLPRALRQLAKESNEADAEALITAANVLDTVAVGLASSSPPDIRMEDAYAAGVAALRKANESGGGGGAAEAKASKTSGGGSEAAFARFLKKLKTTTAFFDGLEEGTPKYEERVMKARVKFDSKVAAKRDAAAFAPDSTPAPASTDSPPSMVDGPTAGDIEHAEALKGDGNGLLKKGDYMGALDKYGAAIALDASNAVYLSNRAAALIHLKRYSEAIDDCKRAVALDPGFSRAHERLASAYRHLGMHDLETEALGEAAKLNPADARIANDLRAAQQRVGGVATQSAAGVRGGAGANGMPDLGALMGAMSGAGGAGTGGADAGGIPDLGSLMGMMGAGGPGGGTGGGPDIMQMINQLSSNPAMAGLMQQAMSGGGQDVMQQMMQNPQMMETVMKSMGGMFGGAGGGAEGGGGQGPPGVGQ